MTASSSAASAASSAAIRSGDAALGLLGGFWGLLIALIIGCATETRKSLVEIRVLLLKGLSVLDVLGEQLVTLGDALLEERDLLVLLALLCP